MTEEQFLAGFADAIGSAPESVTLETPLTSLENWDSVAYLAVMTMVDEHMGVVLDPERLTQAKTPGEIYRLAAA